jgi:hypothetical protein
VKLSTLVAIAATSALVAREAPREIQLWNAGANPTDYGVHVWNERSRKEVMSRYAERGNPILLDVEHNGANVEGEPAVTAGYARLELRAGAPWLVFEWSDFGREQIATGQRRFLSPEYDVDKDTGEILALYRVSLVADPGTHRARMLAASANRKDSPMDLAVILAALRAALAAEDPAVCKESISNLLAELSKESGGDTPTEPAMTETDDPPKGGPPSGMQMSADENEDDKEKKAASAPKPAPKSNTIKVTVAADDAVRVIQNATRDHLIEIHGDKLVPSIRRWASSQPLEVVKGLLDATPAKETTKTRASATRGASTGAIELTDRERAMCAAKNIDPAKYAETRAAIQARSNGTGG